VRLPQSWQSAKATSDPKQANLHLLGPKVLDSKVDSRLFLLYYLNAYRVLQEALPCRE